MRRATNVWDRFYRYHKAPWRGERTLSDMGLLGHVGKGRFLELGCGNGKLLRPLLRAGIDVVALDVSFHALRRLDHDARVLADARWLPFADASFDAVLDIHCTGHLLAPGRAEAMREVARILAPGGSVWIERLMPQDMRRATGTEVEPDTMQLADGRTTHFSDEAELRAACAEAGLVVADIAVERRGLSHRGEAVERASIRIRAVRDDGRATSSSTAA